MLQTMSVKVTGFEKLREDYETCPDFGEMYASRLSNQSSGPTSFMLHDGYLFQGA